MRDYKFTFRKTSNARRNWLAGGLCLKEYREVQLLISTRDGKRMITAAYSALTFSLGLSQVFEGNTDRYTHVEQKLPEPISLTAIRIRPVSWNIKISMRFELIGCLGSVNI